MELSDTHFSLKIRSYQWPTHQQGVHTGCPQQATQDFCTTLLPHSQYNSLLDWSYEQIQSHTTLPHHPEKAMVTWLKLIRGFKMHRYDNTNTVLAQRVEYFVLLYYSHKSWSIIKTRGRFKICWSWRFQNTPYMYNLTMFWLRYLRLKTHDTILLFSW